VEISKLTETVLLQLECFWILQELDEGCRQKDPLATSLMDNLYANRPVGWQKLHPFVRLNTTISLLVVPISFAARLSEDELRAHGFSLSDKYDLVYRQGGDPANPTPRDVLRVLRNSVAHLPDFAAGGSPPNISFDEGILRCWSQNRSSEVVFRSEAGFVYFVGDLLRLCRRACLRLLQPQ